jgi:cytochrome c oxidase cbb3-type subunit I/II
MTGQTVKIEYDDKVVRMFMIASILFGVVGMGAGVIIASQLNFWQMNGKFIEWLTFGLIPSEGLEYLTYGRLRPLHTNAAIFAFVGNMMFAGIYYSTQRLCKTRLASDFLSKLHFWGWQAIIVGAAITLPLGLTRGKEYAELIWPINIAVALIWVVFAINFFWTLAKRNEPTLYVAIWFYIATILTVAMLYIVNHLSLPTSLVHSYPIFGGVQDALVQWWYGHNAVAFFLTTPILGIMYYFVPKAAERPVYSYRLSVIHFWSLVFVYIWAGPHHLLNTALPQWTQLLGMLFSLMLWAPSWGGMLNGLLTLRGAWHKLRDDPSLKFFAAGVTFYGMATFEGPLLSIRAVNALGHYTDWIIGHVHAGTLGWNGFMAAGMFYFLAPKLWNTRLYSRSMANLHFWIGFVGILLYVASMWVSGITQGLMLNSLKDNNTLLSYPNFLDTLNSIKVLMGFRLLGGALYLSGWLMLCYNIYRTIRSGSPVNGTIEVYVERKDPADHIGLGEMIFNRPTVYSLACLILIMAWMFGEGIAALIGLFGTIALVLIAILDFQRHTHLWSRFYDRLLANPLPFSVLVFIAAAIGGCVQIIPMLTIDTHASVEDRKQTPYTPLELMGRDIYISEGCYTCHSQMVRTMVPDVLRYGSYSRIGESIYDHPFQWGSRRTGPDLHREGGKYSNEWQFRHLEDPRSMSPGSIMPSYPWLIEKDWDSKVIPGRIAALVRLGVPYPAWNADFIRQTAHDQAVHISKDLRNRGIFVSPDRQIVALIAYLQRLGRNPELDEAIAAFTPAPAESGVARNEPVTHPPAESEQQQ